MIFDDNTVSFLSYQLATQACLEVLGTTVSPTPVIMPITSTPDVLSGVLRAGGHACLLDVDPTTLLIEDKALDEALNELDAAILLTNTPAGWFLQDTGGMPHIVATKELPTDKPQALGDFTIYDLSTIGGGAIVVSKYKEQLEDLKLVRSGVLGLSADMPFSMERNINDYVDAYGLDRTYGSKMLKIETYRSILDTAGKLELAVTPAPRSGDGDLFSGAIVCSHFLMRVPNVHSVLSKLRCVGAVQAVYPLHFISAVRSRWSTTPSYPNAEMLANTTIALDVNNPQQSGLLKKILEIV